MKSRKKRGPKLPEYKITVHFVEKSLSDLDFARIEKFLDTILVNAEEEVANEGKPKTRHLLPRLVG